jgi:hypothetical protein
MAHWIPNLRPLPPKFRVVRFPLRFDARGVPHSPSYAAWYCPDAAEAQAFLNGRVDAYPVPSVFLRHD